MSAKCDFDQFCYVCSYFTPKKYRIEITVKVMKLFRECYREPMRNLESNYCPSIICKICYNMLCHHLNDNKSLTIVQPARWRDPLDHSKDCFSCNTNTNGANQEKRQALDYHYNYTCKAPVFRKDISNYSSSVNASSPTAEQPGPSSVEQQRKVGKFFNDHGLLEDSVDWTSHLGRETSLVKYFDELPDGTPYCKEVRLLIEDWFGLLYVPSDYRLFLDSGKGSLKAYLLSNNGRLRSLPLLYSTTLKETQDDVEKVLHAIKYSEHNWSIVADLKMVGVLLGKH